MALKDWKKTGINYYRNKKSNDLIQIGMNPNRPKNERNSYQVFLFYEGKGVPELITRDNLVSKSQAIAYAKEYMENN